MNDVANDLKQLSLMISLINDTSLSFQEAREQLFNNKSREWIDYYIVYLHPEVLTTNGGWITPRAGSGHKRIIISRNQAKLWLYNNRQKIDWNSSEPTSEQKRLSARNHYLIIIHLISQPFSRVGSFFTFICEIIYKINTDENRERQTKYS